MAAPAPLRYDLVMRRSLSGFGLALFVLGSAAACGTKALPPKPQTPEVEPVETPVAGDGSDSAAPASSIPAPSGSTTDRTR